MADLKTRPTDGMFDDPQCPPDDPEALKEDFEFMARLGYPAEKSAQNVRAAYTEFLKTYNPKTPK